MHEAAGRIFRTAVVVAAQPDPPMHLRPAAFQPLSHSPSRDASAPDASGSTPKFIRSPKDLAPRLPVPGPGLLSLDPRASQEEKLFFDDASQGFANTLPLIGVRLMQFLKGENIGDVRHERFMFKQEPASVQGNSARVVIDVGSEEAGTEGQVSVVNGRVEWKGAAMNDIKQREAVIQHATLALGIHIAREKNMPYAAAQLQKILEFKQRELGLG